MAKTSDAPVAAVETPSNDYSEPRTLAPLEGGNTFFAAWDMFYHVFGMRADRIDVTPEGVFLVDLTLPKKWNLDLILADTAKYTHRLDLTSCYFWLYSAPVPPMDSMAISTWQSQWFGGSGSGKRGVAEYVLAAANDYRADKSLGRGAKTGGLAHIDPANFDPHMLEGIDPNDLIMFKAAVESAIANRVHDRVSQ